MDKGWVHLGGVHLGGVHLGGVHFRGVHLGGVHIIYNYGSYYPKLPWIIVLHLGFLYSSMISVYL